MYRMNEGMPHHVITTIKARLALPVFSIDQMSIAGQVATSAKG